jgi:hypothetical protein
MFISFMLMSSFMFWPNFAEAYNADNLLDVLFPALPGTCFA